MNKLVSIIIPIYKVESYLDKCINSVVAQTYKNLEIILVDDGSPDNCPQICDLWAKKDNRIKVIHKQNGGLSSARNAGLDVCKGDYICFIDSDDWVEPTYVEELYSTLTQNNADLALCGVNNIDENGSIHEMIPPLDKSFYKKTELSELMYIKCFKKNLMIVVAWNKLYKKEIWQNLRYPLGKVCEDEFVLFDILNSCNNGIAITNSKLYNYLYRKSSIMNSLNYNIVFDGIDATIERYNKFEDKYLKQMTATEILNSYIIGYKRFYKHKIAKEIVKRFRKDYKIYKKDIKSLRLKMKYFIFKICPSLATIKK